MKERLVIDIGNSVIKAAAFYGMEIVELVKASFHDMSPIESLAERHVFSACMWAAVGKVTGEFREFTVSLPFPVTRILTRMTPAPMIKNYEDIPTTCGIDRLASVVGAMASSPKKDILVVDAGTAITYDFVSREGVYLPGNISAGIGLRLQALHDYTALLPLVDMEGAVTTSPNSTEECLRSGAVLGADYEIRAYIDHYRKEHGDIAVYLTGGGSLYLPLKQEKGILSDDNLVLKGIAILGDSAINKSDL